MSKFRDLDELQEARRMGLGRLLLLAHKRFLAQLSEKMEGKGPPGLPGHMLLPLIDAAGTRSVELARRAGISKQAVAKVVRELEQAGIVRRMADPEDARAELVTFTKAGLTYLQRILTAVSAIEREYQRELGSKSMAQLRRALVFMAQEADETGATRRRRS